MAGQRRAVNQRTARPSVRETAGAGDPRPTSNFGPGDGGGWRPPPNFELQSGRRRGLETPAELWSGSRRQPFGWSETRAELSFVVV